MSNTTTSSPAKSGIQTKWTQMLESPKGCKEYNPTQCFSLQVFWVVRSPKAAAEMIEKGFKPCGKATMRDTPTTLAYIFRISRDQRLAEKLKSELKTIGQHPHYQAAFKSIQMGIPRAAQEMKLRQGGIDIAPLSWAPEEPIAGHEAELDYDPVVLECTEIYLDNRAFYEHTASHEWMKYSAEILKACRSLKPKTYCVGNPSQKIWETAVEPSLKAIRFTQGDERQQVKDLQPGVYCNTTTTGDASKVLFIELDLAVGKEKLQSCQALFAEIQKELAASYMIVLPTNLDPEQNPDSVEVRVTLAVAHVAGLMSKSLGLLAANCDKLEGRVISYGVEEQVAQQFAEQSGLEAGKITILDSQKAEQSNMLAGYALHPLFRELVSNTSIDYQV